MSLNKFMILEKSDKEFDINEKVLFTMAINFQNGNQLQRVWKKKKTCMMSKQKITLVQNNSLNLLHIKQKFRNTTQITINFEVQKSLTILPYTNNLLKNIFTEWPQQY